MKSDRRRRGKIRAVASLIVFEVLVAGAVFVASPQGIRASNNADAEKSPPILRGNAAVVVHGTVVAISQDTVIEGEASSADLMVLKIENVLSGKDPGHYVRADFNHSSSVKIEPEKARAQRRLLVSLRAGKTMKVHLRPPVEGVECRWPVPAPPKPGEEVGIATPIMLRVGNAKGYPDINKLPCYAFELQDFEEITSSDTAK